MSSSADVVARAKLINFKLSRQVQGDAVEDVVSYALAEFAVSEVIRGDVNTASLPIEFLLDETPERAIDVVAEQAAAIPTTEVIVLLRRKRGHHDRGYYRLVNSSGLWAARSSGVWAPLSPSDVGEPLVLPHPLKQLGTTRRPAEISLQRPATPSDDDRPAALPNDEPVHTSDAAADRYADELTGVHSLEQLAQRLRI